MGGIPLCQRHLEAQNGDGLHAASLGTEKILRSRTLHVKFLGRKGRTAG